MLLGEFIELCGKTPGMIMNQISNKTENINECAMMPTMCKNGKCIDTPGSFECECPRG